MCKNHCKHCGNETKNQSYCSRSCANIGSKKTSKVRITKKCRKCDNIVKRSDVVFCSTHYKEYLEEKEARIQNTTLEQYTTRPSITNQHPSSKFAHIRGLARSKFKHLACLPCFNCGYDKHVELCHIKPLSSFPSTATISEVNNIKNIIQLCPNCQWEFDNGKLHLDFPDQLKSQ